MHADGLVQGNPDPLACGKGDLANVLHSACIAIPHDARANREGTTCRGWCSDCCWCSYWCCCHWGSCWSCWGGGTASTNLSWSAEDACLGWACEVWHVEHCAIVHAVWCVELDANPLARCEVNRATVLHCTWVALPSDFLANGCHCRSADVCRAAVASAAQGKSGNTSNCPCTESTSRGECLGRRGHVKLCCAAEWKWDAWAVGCHLGGCGECQGLNTSKCHVERNKNRKLRSNCTGTRNFKTA
mmetsp:Transcript_3600/g.6035  ORF Transcript_3600/g.6035 Transcript_3600/m.6035 type:complete len:244 (-) Transcript_3600:23-754(-)